METISVEDLERWIRGFAQLVSDNQEHLTQLDASIGDADHGTNMHRGMTAVVTSLDAVTPATPAALFKQVGMTLVSTVGGASGPLFGTLFLRMGTALGDAAGTDASGFASALRAGLDGVVARGKAEAGDKTMYDALSPAVAALDVAIGEGQPLAAALRAANEASAGGRDATIPMLARKGRASYLGERSVGHQDPGATTIELLLHAAAVEIAAASDTPSATASG